MQPSPPTFAALDHDGPANRNLSGQTADNETDGQRNGKNADIVAPGDPLPLPFEATGGGFGEVAGQELPHLVRPETEFECAQPIGLFAVERVSAPAARR